jgi:hypothetical protein
VGRRPTSVKRRLVERRENAATLASFMGASQAVEALLAAHTGRATGELTFTAGAAQSRVYFRLGAVVDAHWGFGAVTLTQGLLASGRLDASTFDALWASGEAGHLDDISLKTMGLSLEDARRAQVLRSLQRVAQLAERAEFEEREVQSAETFPRVQATEVLRAVWDGASELPRTGRIRCTDLSVIDAWGLEGPDRALVEKLTAFEPIDAFSPAEISLLALLVRDQKAELLSAEEWEKQYAPPTSVEVDVEVSVVEEDSPIEAVTAVEPASIVVEEAPPVDNADWGAEAAPVPLSDEQPTETSSAYDEAPLAAAEAQTQDASPLSAEDAWGPEATTEPAAASVAPEDDWGPEVPSATEEDKTAAPAEEPPAEIVSEWPPRSAEEQPVWEAVSSAPAVDIPSEWSSEAEPPPTLSLFEPNPPSPSKDAWSEAAANLSQDAEPAVKPQAAPSWNYDTEAPPSEMNDAWDTAPETAAPVWEQMEEGSASAELPVMEMSSADMEEPGAWLHASNPGSWADALEGAFPAMPVTFNPPPPPVEEEALPAMSVAPPTIERVEALSGPAQVPPGLRPATRRPRVPVESDPPSPPSDDSDLWGLVRGSPVPASDQAETLEDALKNADAMIEDLMSLQLRGETTSTPPVAELVEASIEEAPAVDVSPAKNAQWQDTSWNWDEEEDVAGDPSDAAEAAKLRRQRLMRRAVQNLGGIPQRPTGPSNHAPVSTPQAPPAADAPVAAPVPPAPRPLDDQALADRIEKRAEQLKKKPSHFEVLGLGRTATKDQVKSAFLSLAKSFHPDRLPASLQELAPKMTHVFESIREAYETLYDDSKREFYASNLKAKPAEEKPATPAEQAVAAFKRAEALFKKKDYAGAEAELEAASKLDNKAVYLAVRAWVVYTDRKDAAQAKQMMGEALKVDPKCDRAHYQLGVIARVEGDMDKAEKHFREAVRYNPRHAEANQELRLIDMRKKKSK